MKYTPYPYQSYAAQRILDDPAVGLFLRPGLGKTVITLTAINELRRHRWAVSRALVIAPKKVAEATWTQEAQKWDHLQGLRVVVVMGTVKQRIRALMSPGDAYVISRDSAAWLVDHYRQKWPFDMLVCDESTSFKNSQSKRFKALKAVRRFCKKVVLLTGTPSSNGLLDLWAQIYLLDGGERLGKAIGQYRERYFNRIMRGDFPQYDAKADAREAVFSRVKDICISMSAEDYLDLPECVTHDIPVVLDNKALVAYRKFRKTLLLELAGGETVTANSAAALVGKLQQFCNGAIYGADGRMLPVHDCKLEAYSELLEQMGGEPCVTFYWYQHDRDRLLAWLADTGLRVRVYGGPEDTVAWNAGEIDVLLAQPQSCAFGLNLQVGGRQVVWFGLTWSFELADQGRCRLWRQGSPYDRVFVHRLIVQGGVDADIVRAVSDKTDTHEAIMAALRKMADEEGVIV